MHSSELSEGASSERVPEQNAMRRGVMGTEQPRMTACRAGKGLRSLVAAETQSEVIPGSNGSNANLLCLIYACCLKVRKFAKVNARVTASEKAVK